MVCGKDMSPTSKQTIGLILAVIIVGAGAAVGGYYLGYSQGSAGARPVAPLRTEVTGTLEVFEWSGYEVEELWGTFKRMYPNVNVKFSFFVDEAEALTKLQAGFRPDIVHPCSDNIRLWYEAGVIEPLDISLIPNWEDISEEIKAKIENSTIINGEHYFVPVDFGYFTISYMPEALEELGIPKKDPVTGEENWDTYSLLFDYREELRGKISLFDSVDTILQAAIAAGIPKEEIWNMTDEQLDLVKAKLEEGKPMVRAYWSSPEEVVSMMASGEIVAANTWGQEIMELKDEGYNVTYAYPVEGRILWICGFSLVQGFRERKPALWEAAHAFINAWLDPVAGAWLIDNYWIGSPSSLAPFLVEDVEMMAMLGLASTETIETGIAWQYRPNADKWELLWSEYRA